MKIIFLSYVNRSGSTYLTNLLSSSPEVMGCPEGDWMVGHLLEDPQAQCVLPKDLARTFEKDPKMKHWHLERNDLEWINQDLDLSNMKVFVRIIETMKNKIKPKADKVIFKAERLVHLFDRIRKCENCIDESIYLYLIRDIRSVWLSQKNTLNPLSQEPFSNSPVKTALFWEKQLKALERHTADMEIIRISYERMILGGNRFYRDLEERLNLAGASLNPMNGDYVSMVPPDHRPIHKDLLEGPLTGKIEDWKSKLPLSDVQVIERVAGNVMQRYGYTLSESYRVPSPLTALWIYLRVMYYDFLHLYRKLAFYFRRIG